MRNFDCVLYWSLIENVDLEHQLWLLSLDDRLGLAPPCQPNAKVGRVLDVGTGTGIWALNYGDEHPEAEVMLLAIYWIMTCEALTLLSAVGLRK